MGVLLKILIFLFIFYYIFKIIGRIFFPFLITNKINNMEKEKRRANADYAAKKKAEEGKITIENIDKSKRGNNNFEGEYVDYEEVK